MVLFYSKHFNFPIQSFQISVPIPRAPLKRLGEFSPRYKVPTLPTEAIVSFSAIKNDITGMDFSKIVLEKGDFEFFLATCNDVSKSYGLNECSLLGISESINLDGNATIDFNYVSSLTNQSFFLISEQGLYSSDDFLLESNDSYSLLPS
jgi:hypothetical protein